MPDNGPADPITALAAGAAASHELFNAYLEAGFTRAEALQLVIAMLESARQLPPAKEAHSMMSALQALPLS